MMTTLVVEVAMRATLPSHDRAAIALGRYGQQRVVRAPDAHRRTRWRCVRVAYSSRCARAAHAALGARRGAGTERRDREWRTHRHAHGGRDAGGAVGRPRTGLSLRAD